MDPAPGARFPEPDWRTVETRSRPASREILSARSASRVVVEEVEPLGW